MKWKTKGKRGEKPWGSICRSWSSGWTWRDRGRACCDHHSCAWKSANQRQRQKREIRTVNETSRNGRRRWRIEDWKRDLTMVAKEIWGVRSRRLWVPARVYAARETERYVSAKSSLMKKNALFIHPTVP